MTGDRWYSVDEIANLASQIISAKKEDSQSDTNSLENTIDQLVYELYGITDEEIKIIEDSI
tara:strand:- start:282 stop:464 length:183 start_codon:yes stop_codon:yes gene_type:complete